MVLLFFEGVSFLLEWTTTTTCVTASVKLGIALLRAVTGDAGNCVYNARLAARRIRKRRKTRARGVFAPAAQSGGSTSPGRAAFSTSLFIDATNERRPTLICRIVRVNKVAHDALRPTRPWRLRT